MSRSLLLTLLLLAFAASVLLTLAPAFAQAPGDQKVNPNGVGFAVPPRDAAAGSLPSEKAKSPILIYIAIGVAVVAGAGYLIARKKS